MDFDIDVTLMRPMTFSKFPGSARRVPQHDLIAMPGPAQVQCPASGCREIDG